MLFTSAQSHFFVVLPPKNFSVLLPIYVYIYIHIYIYNICTKIIQNLLGKKHACNNTYLNTSHGMGRSKWSRFHYFINKTDPKYPKKRENYWRHSLKTMAPQGLNAEDN